MTGGQTKRKWTAEFGGEAGRYSQPMQGIKRQHRDAVQQSGVGALLVAWRTRSMMAENSSYDTYPSATIQRKHDAKCNVR